MDYILSDIEQNGQDETDNFRVLLWDNLNSHLSAFVLETVESCPGLRRFFSVARPSYQPKYGPIEYKICDLTKSVQLESQEEWTLANLEQKIISAAAWIGPFWLSFDHCGYPVDWD